MGYVLLAAAVGWLISGLAVLAVNPANITSHIVSIPNALGCYYGFHRMRRRRDPRFVMGVMMLSAFIVVAIMSFHHSGLLAPSLSVLPAAACISAFYLRGRMRQLAFAVGIVVVGVCYLTSSGMIGLPTTYTPDAYAAMWFVSLGVTMTCIVGVAWLANLSRDYAIEKLEAARVAVAESAARSQIAMEASKVGLWDVPDADLRRFHVSESFETITGYTGEEFNSIFDHLDEFVHPDDLIGLREAFAIGRKRLSRLRVDFRLMTRERGYRWFSTRARYMRNPDGSTRISGSLQDINFIKAAEEALRTGRDRAREANKAKTDFIAVMSHEVRTPLNAILGSVEMLKRGGHDAESDELIALIDDAGHGLLAMVNDLLDLSKIEAGKINVIPQATDMRTLVSRTVAFWRPQASSKGLTLSVDCGEATAPQVMVDPVRVRQILGNLISNAVKFTDEGAISVRLSMLARPDGRAEIQISVIDDGPGVPDDAVESIFAPFEQTPSDHGRGGTGLGLFISRRLARLMEGDVTLEPARAKGSHFRVSLVADHVTAAPSGQSAMDPDPLWAGQRVLCVDDNEHNRRIASLLLSKFGLDVTACASGAEALDICGIQTFDVILMDIVMPDMDGMEALRKLRGDETGRNTQTPAIALTAKLTPDDVASYAAAGFDGVAGKPVSVRELAQAIAPFMVGASMPAMERTESAVALSRQEKAGPERTGPAD